MSTDFQELESLLMSSTITILSQQTMATLDKRKEDSSLQNERS